MNQYSCFGIAVPEAQLATMRNLHARLAGTPAEDMATETCDELQALAWGTTTTIEEGTDSMCKRHVTYPD